MAFLRATSYLDPQPELRGRGVRLRLPTFNDHEEWAELREESRAFLSPWEPVWPPDDLTRSAFRQRVKRYARDLRTDTGYAYFVFCVEFGRLVGGLTLSNVRRGVAQTGFARLLGGRSACSPRLHVSGCCHRDHLRLRPASAAPNRGCVPAGE